VSARDEILRSAERLFAEHGVDGISLREINRAAQQRNATAIQYHFQDRDGLLLAVVDRWVTRLASDVQRRLDELDETSSDPASVVRCLVEPMFGLADLPGGADFLRIAAQILDRTTREPVGDDNPSRLLSDDRDGTFVRWAQRLGPLMDPAVTGAPLHQRFAVLRFAYLEMGRRLAEEPERRLGELFRSHLVDLLVAIALAPPSELTRSLLARRTPD
jgi:AcrR family transcriptional regulator